jgi:integrase
VRGLFLYVDPAGERSYRLRFDYGGLRGETEIAGADMITLADARAKALVLLGDLIVRGRDPRLGAMGSGSSSGGGTLSDLAGRYRLDAQRRKRAGTLAYENWLIDRHILPRLGQRPFADLRRAELIGAIEEIGAQAGPVTANRAHALLRLILNFALKRDLIEYNPAAGIDRIFPEISRERVLATTEIRALWGFLERARANAGEGLAPGRRAGERPVNGVSPGVALALQLCLVTLQRAGEVAGARRSELSLPDRVWIIPAERMKSKRAHLVPLSDLAIRLFEAAMAQTDSPFVFPSRNGSASIDPKRLTRALSRICVLLGMARAGPHDLRRTGRTLMTSEAVGVSYEAAERVIAHLVGSAVSRVYDRNEYVREKRAALGLWAEALEELVQAPEAGRGAQNLAP